MEQTNSEQRTSTEGRTSHSQPNPASLMETEIFIQGKTPTVSKPGKITVNIKPETDQDMGAVLKIDIAGAEYTFSTESIKVLTMMLTIQTHMAELKWRRQKKPD